MSDILSASIDVCVPSAIAAHREHKARLKRIAARAFIAPPEPDPPPPPEQIAQDIEALTVAIVEKTNAEFRALLPFSIATIQHIVAQHFGLTRADITSQPRTKHLVHVRQLAIYLCREFGFSHKEIGRRTGGRDHSTAIHAIARVRDKIESSIAFSYQVQAIKQAILDQRAAS